MWKNEAHNVFPETLCPAFLPVYLLPLQTLGTKSRKKKPRLLLRNVRCVTRLGRKSIQVEPLNVTAYLIATSSSKPATTINKRLFC